MGEKICISDLTLDALTAYIVGLGQPKFRAKQIFKWLHQKLVTEFSQMTDQQGAAGPAGGAVHDCSPRHPPPPAVQGRYGQVSFAAGRRQLHRDRAHALQIRQYCLCVHPGGLRDGLPVLRLHPGGPRARPDGRGDRGGNLHRTEGHRRARLPHCFDGHR